jgi:hypothetical protein
MVAAVGEEEMTAYEAGTDVLGDGVNVGDFIPWLGLVGKVVGSVTGSSSPNDKALKEAADKAAKEALAKQQAQAAAARNQLIMVAVLGAVGLGGMFLILNRRK